MEHDEHLGPDERSHCDDLLQSGRFTQTSLLHLLQEYDRKLEQLSEDQKLFKLCSDTGSKVAETRQDFHTLDTERLQKKDLYREYTMPQNEKRTRIRRWMFKNMRIGPVLNIRVCFRDDRYSIEVQIPPLFEDNTVSWVRIVNDVDRYVTESIVITNEENTTSKKHIATARPRQKPTITLTSTSTPAVER